MITSVNIGEEAIFLTLMVESTKKKDMFESDLHSCQQNSLTIFLILNQLGRLF